PIATNRSLLWLHRNFSQQNQTLCRHQYDKCPWIHYFLHAEVCHDHVGCTQEAFMDSLWLLLGIGVWILLQAVVLPRLGVST
ncbi:MAG: hypothetical protein AB8I69_18245, partial [Anaerolineae bacterium]